MSDFDDNGRRIPDCDEREESIFNRLVCCHQCNTACGKWYPAERPTSEYPGCPAECDCYEGSVEDEIGRLFCSAECLRIYTEE